MRPLITDISKQADLEANGFIKGPVIDVALRKTLLEEYAKLREKSSTSTFFTTTMSTDRNYRHEANDVILKWLTPVLNNVFDNYKIIYANFMVKPAGKDTECHLHQDWTYVDEEKYCTLNIWIPLIDLGIQNGTIYTVPQSHRFDTRVRGRNIWWPYYDNRANIIEKMAKPVMLSAGEAIIFNSKTFHYSPPNLTETDRTAVSVVVTYKEADLMHYYAKDGTIYKAPINNPSFYTDFGINCEGFEQGLQPIVFADQEEYKLVMNRSVAGITTDQVSA